MEQTSGCLKLHNKQLIEKMAFNKFFFDKNESEYKINVINIVLTFVQRMLGTVDIDGKVRMD